MKRWGGDEVGRGIPVINPRLLTGTAHFSAPCLVTCGASQWTTARCVPEQPPLSSICVKEEERRQAWEHLPFAGYWYSAPLNTDQSICCHTLRDTVTSTLYADSHISWMGLQRTGRVRKKGLKGQIFRRWGRNMEVKGEKKDTKCRGRTEKWNRHRKEEKENRDKRRVKRKGSEQKVKRMWRGEKQSRVIDRQSVHLCQRHHPYKIENKEFSSLFSPSFLQFLSFPLSCPFGLCFIIIFSLAPSLFLQSKRH